MKLTYKFFGEEMKTYKPKKGSDIKKAFCKRFNCELLHDNIIKWNKAANAYDIIGRIFL